MFVHSLLYIRACLAAPMLLNDPSRISVASSGCCRLYRRCEAFRSAPGTNKPSVPTRFPIVLWSRFFQSFFRRDEWVTRNGHLNVVEYAADASTFTGTNELLCYGPTFVCECAWRYML